MKKNSRTKEFQNNDKLLGVEQNTEHDDVKLLHLLLRRFGYLRGGQYKAGCFCRGTECAVRRFQRFHGLTVDGLAGPKTKAVLQQPRCGFPDETNSSNFVLRGSKYPSMHLTYTFVNDAADMSPEAARGIVRGAFDEWARVSPLQFDEVLPSENPTFRIGWYGGSHGDGEPFDGVGRVIAHAFFPPPAGGPHAGDMHFDEAEQFSATADGGIHLGAVAIHEIGHLLGLSHSDERSAIMFPTYDPSRLTLGEDDVEGIQTLYGQPRLRFQASVGGHLRRKDDEAFFAVELPANAAVSLDGPNDADFDLYIKREARPTKEDFDYRAWTTSGDERLRVAPETTGLYHIMVRSYRGGGDFTLQVTLE